MTAEAYANGHSDVPPAVEAGSSLNIQRDNGELLRQILDVLSENEDRAEHAPDNGRAAGWPRPRGALMWILGAAIIGYLANGGDPSRSSRSC